CLHSSAVSPGHCALPVPLSLPPPRSPDRPNAVVIGSVEIGPESSVWFGAVIRGDDAAHVIRIGARTSVQDNCVVHVSDRGPTLRSEEHTSELQSRENLVCRLLLVTTAPNR